MYFLSDRSSRKLTHINVKYTFYLLYLFSFVPHLMYCCINWRRKLAIPIQNILNGETLYRPQTCIIFFSGSDIYIFWLLKRNTLKLVTQFSLKVRAAMMWFLPSPLKSMSVASNHVEINWVYPRKAKRKE